MKFDSLNLERIKQQLLPFRNKVAYNKILPTDQRPLLRGVNYEERMLRNAAVLVPLCNVDNVASVLFTVRSQKLNTHAAQVAFPGGHVDAGETIEQAAMRELFEEMKLTALPLGMWKAARAYTGTMVTPILGYLPPMTAKEVKLAGLVAPQEVSSAFHLTLDHLVKPENVVLEQLSSFKSPRFLGGPEPVWGLTGYFLAGILHDVLSPSLGFPFSTELHQDVSSSSQA